MADIKFGAFCIESLGDTFTAIGETGLVLEEAGFDGLYTGENHEAAGEELPPHVKTAWGLTSSPLTLCAAAAARTTRLRVGTMVLVLPLHHPLEVAKQASAIDVLSQGRFVLGVGIGVESNGFDVYGVPFANRVSLLEEGIEVMKRAWTEDQFSFAGRRYHVKGASLNLRTVQQPHIPIWVAARTEAGAKRAARTGDGLLLDPAMGMEEVKSLVAIYRAMCAKRGTKPFVILMRDVCLGNSLQDARQQYEKVVIGRMRWYWELQYLSEIYDPWVTTIKSADEVTWELVSTDRMIAGDPKQCVAAISRWRREIDFDYLVVEFMLPEGGRARVLDDMRLFGREVIREFKH